MIDPTNYEDFELFTGKGDIRPDPDDEPQEPVVYVPPLRGIGDKVHTLRKGHFLAVNVPDSAKRTVARRIDTVRGKVLKLYPDRTFVISTEWFGVKLTRIA